MFYINNTFSISIRWKRRTWIASRICQDKHHIFHSNQTNSWM